MPTTSRDDRIEFRVPVATKRLIERTAGAMGRTVTDFATEALVSQARRVLREHEAVILSDKDRDIFLKMLDSDPSPNAALLAAAQRHRREVK